MANTVIGHCPNVLRWAREKSALDVDEVARRLKKTPEKIVEWEEGTSAPTYVQLEKLAYELYKRPLAMFFLPEPPAEVGPEEKFRTLTAARILGLSSDTRLAVRQALARQSSLRDLSGGRNEAPRQIHKELRLTSGDEVTEAARLIRDYLGVPFDRQLQWTSDAEALKEWRQSVEDKGVFVFKRPLKQKKVSGFCLVDEEFPVIYLSSSTTKTRQIFTLFHELAHVLTTTSVASGN